MDVLVRVKRDRKLTVLGVGPGPGGSWRVGLWTGGGAGRNLYIFLKAK